MQQISQTLKKFIRPLMTGVAGTSLIALMALSGNVSAQERPNRPYIEVRGAAHVEIAPDALRLSVRIHETHTELAEAKAKIEGRTRTFVESVKALGVAGRDITTQALAIQQEYDYNATPRRLLGVNASRTITIVLRDLSRYSELAAAVVSSNISETQGTQFFLTNENELRNKVQLAAVKDARQRAESIAAAEGRKISGVWSINATMGGGSQRFEMMADAMPQAAMLKTARAGSSDVFESGVLSLEGEVLAVYLLD